MKDFICHCLKCKMYRCHLMHYIVILQCIVISFQHRLNNIARRNIVQIIYSWMSRIQTFPGETVRESK